VDAVLAALLDKGIEDNVFPGAVAGLSIGSGSDRKRFFSSVGSQDIRYPCEKVTKQTFFDLASLTKALSTTLIMYSLLDEQRIQLTDRLSDFFSDIPSDKQEITISQLLSHSSGLKEYHPYYKDFIPTQNQENNKRLRQLILSEKLVNAPGTQCRYSDLGFILLGFVLERVTATSLDKLFTERIATPLGQENQITYIPVLMSRVDRKKYAATEDCPWRKKIMRAEVHDEHCWLMNGVSGHAGLFGTVGSVVTLCEEILDQYKKRGKILNWPEIIKAGLQKKNNSDTWCLGFDTPSPECSSGGKYLSPQSFGHLGYTGTSFWIDPVKDVVVVLLTNRVHPSRENTDIRTFRPYFHNSIFEKLRFTTN